MEPQQLKLIFNLNKIAKNKGADRYVCDTNPEFNIYIPQNISRKNKENIHKKISVNITIDDDEYTTITTK
jgi:hypothetical protein